ncbi:hypothetical protein PVAP13_5KG658607 [Panicum virgatum]|uniref:Uncharacterized protein n=1 Tax=Panicum virgatum TaxID=38727 RepID=A0A8T0SVM7_PANVG|nr:hypothetical protein PVAP13_5KG658607 [Panicum virgatum]
MAASFAPAGPCATCGGGGGGTGSPAAVGKTVDPDPSSAWWAASSSSFSSSSATVLGLVLFVLAKGGEILCIHGGVLFVRVAALVTDAGLWVCLPATVLAAMDCSASSFLYVSAADFHSKSTMRAGESRRWLLWRNHTLESFVEEEGGLTLVGVFVAGDRTSEARLSDGGVML